MTNCNYSVHTKMQRKEIQKQIEELQAKLEELEELEKQEPQMTLVNSGDIDVVSYNHKYHYRMGFSSTGRSWWVRGIGHTALIKVDDPEILVKLEQLYEDMILDTGSVEEQGTWGVNEKINCATKPFMINCVVDGNPPDGFISWNVWFQQLGSKGILHNLKISSLGTDGVEEPEQGTWNYDPDTKFRKHEEVNKLQDKDWNVDVKTNLKPHWEPTPQTEKQVEEGLKEAFREAVKQGVVSSNTKPNSLYDVIADWWDEIFTNGNPSGQNIESLVEQIEKWLPAANEGFADGEYSVGWNDGFNDYRNTLIENLK